MTFTNLGVSQPLIQTLINKGYLIPTPIQVQSIPIVLQGKDIFGCAQTGTGKTAAFALPILQLLQEKNDPSTKKTIKALILAPTRELAQQIYDSFRVYGSNYKLNTCVIFGGVGQAAQVSSLKNGTDIVVATPGRLLDLMNQGFVKLNNVEHFVLDEADRMLDMGFINDIKKIIAKLPKQKQTLFFSATVSSEIKHLANNILVSPSYVSVSPVSSTAETVKQSLYYVNKEDKRSLLKHVLNNDTIEHALVFTRTKRGADKVARDLNNDGIKAEAIHGNKSQGARERALKGFKGRKIRVLVATDIASRGIDVDKLTHVINYEIPEQAETYVHRIGRTGRAGSSGIALSFCAKEEVSYIRDINKLINKNIEIVKSHPFVK